MSGAKIYAGWVYGSALLLPVVLLTWIVPKFEQIYNDMLDGKPLPGMTIGVLRASDLLRQYGWFLVVGLLASLAVYIFSGHQEAIPVWPALAFIGLIIPAILVPLALPLIEIAGRL